MYSGAARFGLGDTADYVANDTSGMYAQDPALARLHQLVVLIVTLRQNFDAQVASGTADPAVLTGYVQLIQQYVAEFKSLRATIDKSTVDQNALGAVDQALLDVANWSQRALQALPDAMAAIPNALLDGLRKILENAGKDLAATLIWPAAIIGVLLLGGIAIVKRGEQTRTGRALARHI